MSRTEQKTREEMNQGKGGNTGNIVERDIERTTTMLRAQISSLKEDGPISLKEEGEDSPDKDTVKSITALTPMRTSLFNGLVLE